MIGTPSIYSAPTASGYIGPGSPPVRGVRLHSVPTDITPDDANSRFTRASEILARGFERWQAATKEDRA